MSSLLNEEPHISMLLNDDPMEVHHAFKLPEPDASILPLIERAGFRDIASIGAFKINPALVAAMVERWRPETHTFHLPVGECTITLEDVALQLGLPVDGNAVTGSCEKNWDRVCEQLLGKPIPANGMVGNQIKFTWLQREFNNVPEGASNKVRRQYCRAYLLQLIGGYILPDKSSNRVNIKYLPLLKNFDEISSYSWGSACLTNLYRMLCKTATCSSRTMGGCTLLLQSWVWYRMPFLAPDCNRPYEWPLAKRWVRTPLSHTKCPKSLVLYRSTIDRMTHEEFEWLPYREFNLPEIAYRHQGIWTTNTAMVCFHIVEWHHADRVTLQFGLVQDIPSAPIDISHMHNITMQGQTDVNWAVYHSQLIDLWNDRENRCVVGRPCFAKPTQSDKYMRWFLKKSRPYISADQHLRDPRGLANVRDVDEEDEQDVPAPPTTQTERRERNRNRHRRAPPTQQRTQEDVPHRHSISHTPTFQEDVPHRHSISHTPTFQYYEQYNQSVEHTPFQDTYRHSTTERDPDMFYECFGVQPGSAQSVALLRQIQEQAGGASSSSVPQYFPEPPPPAPTEEEHQPPHRHQRPRRVPQPRKCGTGSHLC